MQLIDDQHLDLCPAQNIQAEGFNVLQPPPASGDRCIQCEQQHLVKPGDCRVGGHLHDDDGNDFGFLIIARPGRMSAAELLQDHRLAVVGWTDQQQVLHTLSPWPGEQVLQFGKRRYGSGVCDPAVGPDPCLALFVRQQGGFPCGGEEMRQVGGLPPVPLIAYHSSTSKELASPDTSSWDMIVGGTACGAGGRALAPRARCSRRAEARRADFFEAMACSEIRRMASIALNTACSSTAWRPSSRTFATAARCSHNVIAG